MKRVLCLLLATALLVSWLPSMMVTAASSSKTVTYTVSTFKTKSLKKNDTFTVKVSTSAVSAIACVEFKLGYDKTKFSVVSCSTAGYLDAFYLGNALQPVSPETNNGEVWITGLNTKDYAVTKTTVIATVTFKARKDITADSRMFAVTDPLALSWNGVKYKTAVVDGGVDVLKKATIKTQPKSTVVAKGKTATVSVTATGDGLKYQWYVKEPGKTAYKAISGATKSSYKFTMKNAYSGRSFYCSVKGSYGNTVKSKAVTVNQKATIVTQPKSTTVSKNTNAKVTVKAVGGGLKYKWYVKDIGAKSFKVSSVKSWAYFVKMTAKNSGRQIYCVITDKYGNTVKTKTVTLKAK